MGWADRAVSVIKFTDCCHDPGATFGPICEVLKVPKIPIAYFCLMPYCHHEGMRETLTLNMRGCVSVLHPVSSVSQSLHPTWQVRLSADIS